ncbi:MAG: class I SAM-dependent methyltransferase [Gammaproteobacteria bacterium]
MGTATIGTSESMAGGSDWSEGYVTEIGYIHGYCRELDPGAMRLACLSAGVAYQESEELRYLELGYGQGLSINIHATAIDGDFWGTDFNPAQTAHARRLAQASGSGVRLLNDSFKELAHRPDLPEFDIIALHGIWSWISDANRRAIVEIVRKRLRVGGLLYVSYNCLPGWAGAMSVRHLMTLHAQHGSPDLAGPTAKIDAAVSFAQQLADCGARYFKANPFALNRLQEIGRQNRNYLAHEYFNRDWRLMNFSDVSKSLESAKLSFAASAALLEHVDTLHLPLEGQKLVAQIRHPVLKESVRDYFVNQQFRRDIFVKGLRCLTPLERQEAWLKERFVLVKHQKDIPRTVPGGQGDATLHEEVYSPLIEVLAEDSYAPKTVEYLVRHPRLESLQFPQISESLLVLVGAGHLQRAQSPSQASRARCRALNAHLCHRSRIDGDIGFLASPVTGGGVPVSRADQLFILAMQQGTEQSIALADFARGLMAKNGIEMFTEGKRIDSSEGRMTALAGLAEQFATRSLPILRALEVI